MVAPLFDNEQVIGLLYADSDDIRFRYGRNQLRAFNFLANLIAVKISNWRLLQMKQDLDAAVRIVNEMLSTRLPFLPGYDISTRQVPCFEVAGDLFDVAPMGDGRVGIVVGDVTGKGLGAATLMSSTLAALRVLFPEYPEPKMMAERLHRQLLRATDDIHFVTMFIGLLDPDSNRLEYVNAGHNPPMVICDQKKCRTLPTTGMPLGLVAGAKYNAESIELTPGALMCVFTDGVTEAMVGDEIFGEERLQKSVEDRVHLPLREISKGVIEDLRAFLGDEALQDDATMLLLRRQK
jgi:sigma-B regulation protein RsbU (phosphoserine phosphatase)